MFCILLANLRKRVKIPYNLQEEKKIDYWFVVHAGSGGVHNEFDGS